MSEVPVPDSGRRRRRQLLALIAVVLVIGVKVAPMVSRLRREKRAQPAATTHDGDERGRIRGLELAVSRGGIAFDSGLEVLKIDRTSAWYASGLRRGDRIELVGPTRVESVADLIDALAYGEWSDLLIERDGRSMLVELSEVPPQ